MKRKGLATIVKVLATIARKVLGTIRKALGITANRHTVTIHTDPLPMEDITLDITLTLTGNMEDTISGNTMRNATLDMMNMLHMN